MKASNRIRIGHALVAGFAFLAITLGNSATRAQVIVAEFAPTNTSDYQYTGGTSVTGSSLATTPSPLGGTVTWGSTFFTGSGLGSLTLTNLVSHTAATVISVGPPFVGAQLNWTGTATFTLGSNVLSIQITNGTLSVTGDGGNFSGDGNITGSGSAAFDAALATLTQPESFSLALSGLNPSSGLGAFGFNNFQANDDGNVSAGVVPEPSTMVIAGLGALGLIGYGLLRRRKALGA